jgi:hypothetical protein
MQKGTASKRTRGIHRGIEAQDEAAKGKDSLSATSKFRYLLICLRCEPLEWISELTTSSFVFASSAALKTAHESVPHFSWVGFDGLGPVRLAVSLMQVARLQYFMI